MIKTANTFKKFSFFSCLTIFLSIFLACSISSANKQSKGYIDEHTQETTGIIQSPEIVCFYQEQIAAKNLTVQEYYKIQLQEQANELWQELTDLVGIERDVIMQTKDRLKAKSLSPRKKRVNAKNILSPGVLDLVYAVMDDFEIDRNSLTIVPGKTTCVDPHELVICENQLRSVPKNGARSILAHEMIHVKCDDNFTREAIDQFCHKKHINPSRLAYDHIYFKLMRFEEMRADILSALKNISYAQGALESLSVIIGYGDSSFPSHPKSSERLETIQKIAGLLAYEQSQPKQA